MIISRAFKSLKNNGVNGSVRILKNYIRKARFNKLNASAEVPVDDSFTDYSPFDCEYEQNIDFSSYKSKVKPLAFFLPQFYENEQNNAWWGKGFTEWTNTKKAEPRFENHYQPREPHSDIGYYDLSDASTLKRQATLAKNHGIYGFCFYHYWFSGERLLQKPVDMLLLHKEIDINFMLCWANENWTKVWDGQNSNILAEQKYLKNDPERFIDDLKVYISDERYIKIDSKPVIMIYNCSQIPNIKKFISAMRKRAIDIGIGEILIWCCQTNNSTAETLKITDYIDAEVQFPPHNVTFDNLRVNCIKTKERSNIFNYQKLVLSMISNLKKLSPKKPIYPTVMTAWDNSCRRKENYTVFRSFSIKSFYNWVKAAVLYTSKNHPENEQFIFINAFNEWAEGTYLEPDKKYGYAFINTLSKALFSLPLIKEPFLIEPAGFLTEAPPKTAVQVHLYHIEVMGKIIEQLNYIPFDCDIFISTDTPQKQQFIKNSFAQKCKHKNVTVEIFENKGRDVLPFILQMQNRYNHYSLLLHIHSKKTVKSDYGDNWRDYLYSNLLGSEQNINALINAFAENEHLGILFPETYPALLSQAIWGNNRKQTEQLLKRMNIPVATAEDVVFPVGNMFWAKTDAIKNIFSCQITAADFPSEKGQLNSTVAHAIERLWCIVAARNGYTYEQTYTQ